MKGSISGEAVIRTWYVGCHSSGLDVKAAVHNILASVPRGAECPVHWEYFQITSETELRGALPHVFIFVPTTATWSRARHASDHGPPPLRSRNWPWGVPSVFGENRRSLEAANTEFELGLKTLKHAFSGNPDLRFLVIHPEDRGGLAASVWQLRDLATWASQNDCLRGAVNQCAIAPSTSPRPLGFLRHPLETEQAPSHDFIARGWPHVGPAPHWRYFGPLPRRCECRAPHISMKRTPTDAMLGGGSIFVSPVVAAWFIDLVFTPSFIRQFLRAGLLKEGGAPLSPARAITLRPRDSTSEDESVATWPEDAAERILKEFGDQDAPLFADNPEDTAMPQNLDSSCSEAPPLE